MTMEVLGVDTCLEFEPSQTPPPLSQPVPFSQEQTQLLDVEVAMYRDDSSVDEALDVFNMFVSVLFVVATRNRSATVTTSQQVSTTRTAARSI